MALTRVNALRRLADRLGSGEIGAEGVWLAGALRQYLDHACTGMSLPVALNLEPSWWLAERRARRDNAFREYAERFLAGRDDAADALGTAVRRYESGRWLSDRRAGRCPPQFNGSPREVLFTACWANSPDGSLPMPTSEKQIKRILSNCDN